MPARWLAVILLAGCLPLTGCRRTAEVPAPSNRDASVEETPTGPPLFEDVTPASGVRFSYRNGEDSADHLSILESLGGGVGLLDYDGDGRLDLFFPGGGFYTGKDLRDIVGSACKLYRNQGNGTFADVTAAAGLDRPGTGQPWFYSHAAAVADYDRDGWPDLLVTGWQRVALFRNVADGKGGRRFEDVSVSAGLDRGVEWATSAAWGDLDGDGYPDLYVCQYVDWSWKKNPRCQYDGKKDDICPPRDFAGLTHRLYRNTGKGAFVEVGKEAGIRPADSLSSKGLGVLIVDVDADGKPDIYVCNDTVDNYLYVNQSSPGRLRFAEVGLTSGVARDDRGTPNGSMGVDAGDPSRSGKPAIWVTNYENELHALYSNECRPGVLFFNYHTQAAGIAAIGQAFVGWGTNFVDVDLDGWEDLFVSNGHAIRYPTGRGVTRLQRPVLLHNQRGRFTDISARIGAYGREQHLGRGVGFGDLDNDGRIDLVTSHCNAPAALLRGVGGKNAHWLGIELRRKGHADIVGSRVMVETADGVQTRFAKGGGSYASSGDRRLHFGLGAQTAVQSVIVHWPDGSRQTFRDLPIDRYHVLTQGDAAPRPYPQPRGS